MLPSTNPQWTRQSSVTPVRLASSGNSGHGNMNRHERESGGPSVSKPDRKSARNGVPGTVTTIPLTDPHALPVEPSIGELVKDATAQMSTLVRAEVELARAEITRDVKKALTGSIFFISALVVLFYSTFFFFFFVAELLHLWIWRWAAYLIVFGIMVVVTAALALFGFLKVRRIRGPRQTIASVKETRTALTPGHSGLDKAGRPALTDTRGGVPADPSGW